MIDVVLSLLGEIADDCAIFPLWAMKDGACTCGQEDCKNAGKHPSCWWSEIGPAAKVTEQFNGKEPTSYGICTGSRSGNLFVLDCDVKPGIDGVSQLQRIADSHRYVLDTRVHSTPSGGKHFWFRAPPGFVVPTLGTDEKTRFGLGIDVRGEKGGFVVAPGCPHKSGGTYAVESARPVADAPKWLLDELSLRRQLVHITGGDVPEVVSRSLDSPIGQCSVDAAMDLCLKAPPAVQTEGGSVQTMKVASRLVRKWMLPPDAALDIMEELYSPRCQPPWSRPLLAHKINSALKNPSFVHEEWPEEYCRLLLGGGEGDVRPEGAWHEALLAKWTVTFRARARGVKIGHTPTRKQPDPNHVYTFIPGKDTSAMGPEPKAMLPVDIANKLATDRDWDGVLQWDSFRQRVAAVNPPCRMHAEHGGKLSDRDVSHIRMWLSCNGVLLPKDDANDVIRAAAERVTFDPVLERLEACREHRVPGILDTMAAEVFGATDDLSQEFLKKTLVAAVRRAKKPGTRVDTVLVLVGDQGAKKTTFVQEMFGVDFVRSQMPDLDNKDASISLQDFWAVELGEIHKILKADKDSVKEFLSRAYDDFIPRYGRNDVRSPRHTIFIGTTNEERFLSDATGNRRYWPIAVLKVDLAWVRRNFQAIWGEALYLAELPTSLEGGEETFDHWFPNEGMVSKAHDPFITNDPWHDAIAKYLEGRKRIKPSDVFLGALGGEIKDFDRAKQMRVSDTLRRLGCKPVKSSGKMVYEIPVSLSSVVREKTTMEKLKERHLDTEE